MSCLQGMITPIVTPMTARHDVDIITLRRLCEIQIDAGIRALFVLGTTGEFYGLTRAQRREAVDTVVEAVEGRVPVVAGISGDSTASSIEVLEDCRHEGISAYVVSTPYFLSYDQGELLDHFRALADAAQAALILYNYPGRYGHVIEMEIIEKLLAERRVFAIKDTQGDLSYMASLLELKKSFSDFLVFEGALPNLAESGRRGIDGSVQALGNLLPDECAKLWACICEQDWAALDDGVTRMWAFHQAIETVAIFIAAMKGCMSLRGWCGSTPTRPTRPVEPEQMSRLSELMAQYYPGIQ